MKRMLVLTLIAVALVALAAPTAFAQAPAPKVTITGLIDNLTSYSRNVSIHDGIFNLNDKMWYGRTRGRFDIIGEVGKAKGVIGFEIDMGWGQAGSADSTIVGAGAAATTPVQAAFGTNGGFDMQTDARGVIELKWLYAEFPLPLIPVPTIARLGAQPFGVTYKLGSYATGDFGGVHVVSTVTPNVKLLGTYVQVEENLVGTQTRNGLSGPNGILSTQNRGDDFAYILAAQITPFKGLDIEPIFSMFYAAGTTAGFGGPRTNAGRGGINLTTAYTGPGGQSLGGVNEYRYTVGLDSRFRMGPFSLDPTILYQFGNRAIVTPAAFVPAGGVTGQKRYANIDAWFFDVRAGFQLGPMLIEGLVVYTTGNKARNSTLDTVSYYQPLATDTSYLADWGTQLTSLGLDYTNAMNEASRFVAYPGQAVGWDKYGRAQLGLKATYAITPELSIMAGANRHWTAEKVDRNGTLVAGGGILPRFAGPRPRDSSRFLGTEFMTQLSYRFAPGISWDNAAGYMIAGPALDAITDPAVGGRNAHDIFMATSRVRFTF